MVFAPLPVHVFRVSRFLSSSVCLLWERRDGIWQFFLSGWPAWLCKNVRRLVRDVFGFWFNYVISNWIPFLVQFVPWPTTLDQYLTCIHDEPVSVGFLPGAMNIQTVQFGHFQDIPAPSRVDQYGNTRSKKNNIFWKSIKMKLVLSVATLALLVHNAATFLTSSNACRKSLPLNSLLDEAYNVPSIAEKYS